MKNYDRVDTDSQGDKYYYLDDKSHRLDGPAVETSYVCRWYVNGYLHRLDGPAVEYANEERHWFQHGELHRVDGPAIEFPDGSKFWYFEGRHYSFKDWLGLVWDGLSAEKKRQYIFGGFDAEL